MTKTSPPTNSARYAIFDRKSVKLRGGFPSREAARTWLEQHPPFRVLDGRGQEVARVATAFEADLLCRQQPDYTRESVSLDEYGVFWDVQ